MTYAVDADGIDGWAPDSALDPVVVPAGGRLMLAVGQRALAGAGASVVLPDGAPSSGGSPCCGVKSTATSGPVSVTATGGRTIAGVSLLTVGPLCAVDFVFDGVRWWAT